jgi:hypothetical protein
LIYGDFALAKIGMGTITPAVALHVKGGPGPGQEGRVRIEDINPTSLATLELINNTGGSFAFYKLASAYPTSGRYTPGVSMIEGNNANGLTLSEISGDIHFYTAGNNERLTIKNGGNIGIGTSNPNERLDLVGNLRLPASTATTGIIKVGADRFIHNYGPNSTFTGVLAGNLSATGSENSGFGENTLTALTSGCNNTATGANALGTNSTGWYNTATGAAALLQNNASFNTATGMASLRAHMTGESNTAIGYFALGYNETGANNTALGRDVGFNNISGSGNVFLGFEAGYNETGSNKLYIANNSTNPPLIYGDFSSARIGLGTITPGYKLDVVGDINFTGDLRKNGTPVTFDGSETKVTAGSGITVTGTGTTADPYVVSAAKDKFYLGQDTLGGIVYYIYKGNDGLQHGLIVSKIESAQPWQSVASLTGADRTEDGAYNFGLMTGSPAKDWITANFGPEWYLPSIDELVILYNNRFHVNKTLRGGSGTLLSSTSYYWSSTEVVAAYAFAFYFNAGGLSMTVYRDGQENKGGSYIVRAIRTF